MVDALDRMVGADNLEAVRVGQIALRHPTTLEPSLSRLAAKAAPAIPSAFARAGLSSSLLSSSIFFIFFVSRTWINFSHF